MYPSVYDVQTHRSKAAPISLWSEVPLTAHHFNPFIERRALIAWIVAGLTFTMKTIRSSLLGGQRVREAQLLKGKKELPQCLPGPLRTWDLHKQVIRNFDTGGMGMCSSSGEAEWTDGGGRGAGEQSQPCPFHLYLEPKWKFQVFQEESIPTQIRNYNGMGFQHSFP